MIAVVDGRLGPAADAVIPALDRAAWYGDAVFETFRTYEGRVLALDARLDRLLRSCALLGIGAPDVSALRRDLVSALEASGESDAYVRIACSRGVGAGGVLPLASTVPLRTVFVGPLPAFSPRSGIDGLRAVTSRSAAEPGGARAAGAKVATYVEPMLALREARALGADDAIGLDRDGSVLEATTSNVFVWDGTSLLSPPASMGVLSGITAGLVARSARQASIDVRPRRLGVHELYRAHEIVLTSSVRGVVAVTTIDGMPVGAGGIGTMARSLTAAYADLVRTDARCVDAAPDSR